MSDYAQLYWSDPYSEPPPRFSDALSDPADANLAPTLYALLPPGAAWRTPDGAAFDDNSRMGGLLRGFAGALGGLYRRIFRAASESSAWSLADSLADWERDYGLPDPCTGGTNDTTIRHKALLGKIRSKGLITPADFIALAASLGYAITIEEPRPFTFGESECGLLTGDEIAGATTEGGAIEYFWIVSVSGQPHSEFQFGISEAGVDRLTDWQEATALECLFRRYAPAWTRPLFVYP